MWLDDELRTRPLRRPRTAPPRGPRRGWAVNSAESVPFISRIAALRPAAARPPGLGLAAHVTFRQVSLGVRHLLGVPEAQPMPSTSSRTVARSVYASSSSTNTSRSRWPKGTL